MKAVVLDTNELMRDWTLRGLKYQLIEHMFHTTWCDFYVPQVVVEELVANHQRVVAHHLEVGARRARDADRMGLTQGSPDRLEFDYREYLLDRFDNRLAFTVLPWPRVSHDQLVRRAVGRIRPFGADGGGYRDALVWQDALDLARQGRDVALVSCDSAFSDKQGLLAPELRSEVDSLEGSVELVRDFSNWLIAQVPWKTVDSLTTAVRHSRASEFYDWYVKSDFQAELDPPIEAIGFDIAPYSIEIAEVDWDGDFIPIDDTTATATADGLTLSWYDIGQSITFVAQFPSGVEFGNQWQVSSPDGQGRVRVEGTVEMILRVAVLFGGEFGFSVEGLSWRRRDGTGQGRGSCPEPTPDHPVLFGT